MIGLLIFGFVLVCAFYAWFSNYLWLIEPAFIVMTVLWLIVKILRSISYKKHLTSSKYEFDWWQDNQGL